MLERREQSAGAAVNPPGAGAFCSCFPPRLVVPPGLLSVSIGSVGGLRLALEGLQSLS